MTYCLIIPHYNHERQFLDFLPELLKTQLPCIIIDDGSQVESVKQIKDFIANLANVYLLEHTYNRGKGAAVKTGFIYARALGFTHAVQIDADGQHAVEDIEKFIEYSKAEPSTFVCGCPTFDASVPKVRLYGRKVTDFWVILETLSFKIKDGLCGFRVYPLKQAEAVYDHYYVGGRMDFDTEILVKAVWLNIPLHFINTKVVYPEKSVSHFNYLRDNMLLIRLHTRLMIGMVLHLPKLVMGFFRGSR
ncbi:glycosyltransferase family 2 protein [Agarilytica rhodophyticola]|uniref:glycosyltransferase family 2 protein n=1 Tax=Agarilytica rhodophyticola TaxID=1737490 RepID=UPI000B346687|nr:glycosyltransferase family 2 protein [Agarilytica rhodophyticola]